MDHDSKQMNEFQEISGGSTKTLEDIDIDPDLRDTLANKHGITTIYPIQYQCFGPLTQGKDLVGKSKTGTGKTLAFVLPLAQRILRENIQRPRGGGTVVILEPTRELAKQVEAEIDKLGQNFKTVCVYGGAAYGPQLGAIERGVDFLVATPGRLLDILEKGAWDPMKTVSVVLDEADEMLKMGFKQELDAILDALPAEKQTMLLSATMPQWVKSTAQTQLNDPVMVDVVGSTSETTPVNITHMACCNEGTDTGGLITSLIKEHAKGGRVIVFCMQKSQCDDLAHHILTGAQPLHGDISQAKREVTMAEFRRGDFQCLVATDVAARGLDIPEVELVVQLEFPQSNESYIHRAGRTGRAGRSGKNILLYAPDQRDGVGNLGSQVGVAFNPIYPPKGSLDEASIQRIEKSVEASVTQEIVPEVFLEMAQRLTESHGPQALAGLISQMHGSEFKPRSLLTARLNFLTVVIYQARTRIHAVQRLEHVLNKELRVVGRVELFEGGVAVDIPALDAIELKKLKKDSQADFELENIEVPEDDLPPEVYTHNLTNLRRNDEVATVDEVVVGIAREEEATKEIIMVMEEIKVVEDEEVPKTEAIVMVTVMVVGAVINFKHHSMNTSI
eukprot:CAMPEP_0175155502 /NCGR_PEP_ID=MMETSP0087-20121206/21019_1 /TAXON_ID=136419 /ORGANISM="Unknown Unknown, Strain D1" /LENGTH=616 /DNA_ID=CAMNT_0016442681 /DNA_START=114 /DNA_END=1965 /DNA_ORIENTATION=-